MEKAYSFSELKKTNDVREHSYVNSITGSQRHELMFAPYQISASEYRTMAFLYFRQAEAEPSVIADSLRVPRQKVTRVLDSLEKKGYVIRKEHPTDRRRIYASLLPEGEKLARELIELETSYSDDVLDSFTPKEIEQYRDLFWKMQKVRIDVLRRYLEARGDDVSVLNYLLSRFESAVE